MDGAKSSVMTVAVEGTMRALLQDAAIKERYCSV